MRKRLRLAACKLSGKPYNVEEFRENLKTLSWPLGEVLHGSATAARPIARSSFVTNGIRIPFGHTRLTGLFFVVVCFFVFFNHMLEDVRGYSCLNVTRSAVATFSLDVDANKPTSAITRWFPTSREACLIKGHPYLQHGVIWDSELVLDWLRKWSPTKCLLLVQLSV